MKGATNNALPPVTKDRDKLLAAIERYAEARIADHDKGGGDPASYAEIEAELKAARAAMMRVIREVVVAG